MNSKAKDIFAITLTAFITLVFSMIIVSMIVVGGTKDPIPVWGQFKNPEQQKQIIEYLESIKKGKQNIACNSWSNGMGFCYLGSIVEVKAEASLS